MKVNAKVSIGIGLALLLLLIVVAYQSGKPKTVSTTKKVTTASIGNTKSACELLTSSDAAKVLGTSSIDVYSPEEKVKSEDIKLTVCKYSKKDGSSIASLTVRAAKTVNGRNSNLAAFNSVPSGMVSVTGVGNAAFWDPATGQLNMLKTNTWYLISFGSTNPQARTSEQAQQLANQLKDKL